MSNNHPNDNIYSILGKLAALKPTPEEKRFALVKEIRESVEAQGSITEGVNSVETKLRKQLAESKLDELSPATLGSCVKEERGLWDNIHAKRKRIKAGSGERMRKPGSKGAPTASALKAAAESFEQHFDMLEEAAKTIDKGEYDYEGQMARNQLQTICRNSTDLIDMLSAEENMPEWVQSKITLAQDYISSVRDYLQSKEELGEEATPYWKKPSFIKRMSQMAKQERLAREKKEAEAKKSVKEELGEAKSYGGGSDNAGGHNVYYTASDGTSQSVYRPGKNQGGSSEPSTHSNAPDPKHPLHGKTVTNGKITGRLVGTSAQGKSAHIKVGDAIHVVDAKSVKKHFIKEEVEEQFDMIEEVIKELAFINNVDSEILWEKLEELTDEELLEYAIDAKGHKSSTGGLTQKGVDYYRSKTPGSKLKMAVTTPPSKLKAGSKAANRRKSFCARMGVEEGEVKKIPGGVRHTKTDYPGYPTDDTLDNLDNLKGPGGGVRKGRPLKAQTKNPRRDPNAPKKGRGRPATAKSGPVSMPSDPFGRVTGRVPKGRKGTVHTVDEAMRLVARNLMVMEGMNFKRMMEEQHMSLAEMVECMNADLKVFKETGVCSDSLRDMMEVYGHAKRQADEGIEQPQQGGIGDVMSPQDKQAKMARLTPSAPGVMGAVKDIGKGLSDFVRGRPETTHEEFDPLEEELNELARLAGLSTEGNAFTGKLKSTPNGGKFDLDGKEYTDTSTLDEEPNEGNAFGQAVRNAKADGIQPGEKVRVGDKQYPVKEAQELVAMLKVAGIDTKQLEEAIEQATQVRGIPVHKPVTPPVTDFGSDNDEEGETCPECDGAGCPECAFGDDSAVDRAHAHAQGMERESAGMAEGRMSEIDMLYQDWVNSEYAPFDSDSGDENLVIGRAQQFLRGKVNPAEIEDIADIMSGHWHGGQGVMDEEELANAPNEKYDTIDATMRTGDADSTGAHRNFGGPGDNLMQQPPNVPARPVRSVKEAILSAEYESIKKSSK